MDLEGEVLRWKFNPLYINFEEDKIKKAFTQYMNIVRLLDYNPQRWARTVPPIMRQIL